MLLLIGAFTIGLILSLLAMGVFISFRIFDFPDITADGSITLGGGGFFVHPGVRTRLTFTAERAFTRSVALAAGVVTGRPRTDHRTSVDGLGTDVTDQLRPIGPDSVGHVHAAAFRFRPIRKGPIDLRETVSGLFEPDQLLGVLHLLHDDRGISGAGESEFVRGACWIAPIAN